MKGEKKMKLNEKETHDVVVKFYSECKHHWVQEKKRIKDLKENDYVFFQAIDQADLILKSSPIDLALMDIKRITHNPYKPNGELLNKVGKFSALEQIKSENNLKSKEVVAVLHIREKEDEDKEFQTISNWIEVIHLVDGVYYHSSENLDSRVPLENVTSLNDAIHHFEEPEIEVMIIPEERYKFCSECDTLMQEGYYIEDIDAAYCEKECLLENMDYEDYLYQYRQYGTAYWTDWYSA